MEWQTIGEFILVIAIIVILVLVALVKFAPAVIQAIGLAGPLGLGAKPVTQGTCNQILKDAVSICSATGGDVKVSPLRFDANEEMLDQDGRLNLNDYTTIKSLPLRIQFDQVIQRTKENALAPLVRIRYCDTLINWIYGMPARYEKACVYKQVIWCAGTETCSMEQDVMVIKQLPADAGWFNLEFLSANIRQDGKSVYSVTGNSYKILSDRSDVFKIKLASST
jgi:hypothetical protein